MKTWASLHKYINIKKSLCETRCMLYDVVMMSRMVMYLMFDIQLSARMIMI